MTIEETLVKVLNEQQYTLADRHISVDKILKFIQNYFNFNYDEVADQGAQNLTIKELRSILTPKIEYYKNFVRKDGSKYFELIDKNSD